MSFPNASFSSKQELLDLQEGPTNNNLSLDFEESSHKQTPPTSLNDGCLQSYIYTGASTLSYPAEAPKEDQPDTPEPDQLCGWRSLRPKCLQVFRRPAWVVFFLCLNGFIQGMVINGILHIILTTIERRFQMRSSDSGLIVSCYDIATCVSLAFVSYFGGRGRKPRWIGCGAIIMGLGFFLFSSPHFLVPAYRAVPLHKIGLCSADGTSPPPGEGQLGGGGGLSNFRYVFMLAQLIHGVGCAPLYSLGVTYIDDNVHPSNAPLYIGIFYTASFLGPATGSVLGGYFLSIFTQMDPPAGLTPDSPLWVGAWWVGFLAGGVAALLVAIPILAFPRHLPGWQEFRAARESEGHQLQDGSDRGVFDSPFGTTIKDMPRSLLLLLKNPTFVFLCLTTAMESAVVSGTGAFIAKIIQSQFGLTASMAATLFGLIMVPSCTLGVFLGGYLVKRLKLRCGGSINLCLFSCVLSLCLSFTFLIHCDHAPVAGVTAPYPSTLTGLDRPTELLLNHSFSEDYNLYNLSSGCNTDCGCDREEFNPVCGADGLVYFSPCFAGCSSANSTASPAGSKVYSSCSCVKGNGSRDVGDTGGLEGPESPGGSAWAGTCPTNCKALPLFLSLLFLCVFFIVLDVTPLLTATLRSVPDSQKSFALGIQNIVVRLLGGIPGPIIYGSLIDQSCVLWQSLSGSHGSCYVYHNSTLSTRALAATVILKILSLTFMVLARILYKPPPESPSAPLPGASGNHLPVEQTPEGGVIANAYARDSS